MCRLHLNRQAHIEAAIKSSSSSNGSNSWGRGAHRREWATARQATSLPFSRAPPGRPFSPALDAVAGRQERQQLLRWEGVGKGVWREAASSGVIQVQRGKVTEMPPQEQQQQQLRQHHQQNRLIVVAVCLLLLQRAVKMILTLHLPLLLRQWRLSVLPLAVLCRVLGIAVPTEGV